MFPDGCNGAGFDGDVGAGVFAAGGVPAGGSNGGVLVTRRKNSDDGRENDGRVDARGVSGGAAASVSGLNSGGVNGVMLSGVSAGVDLSDGSVAMVVKRVPQLEQLGALCGFIVPQIGQRTSVEGTSNAAQFLQNLLFGLLGVPHCGQ